MKPAVVACGGHGPQPPPRRAAREPPLVTRAVVGLRVGGTRGGSPGRMPSRVFVLPTTMNPARSSAAHEVAQSRARVVSRRPVFIWQHADPPAARKRFVGAQS